VWSASFFVPAGKRGLNADRRLNELYQVILANSMNRR